MKKTSVLGLALLIVCAAVPALSQELDQATRDAMEAVERGYEGGDRVKDAALEVDAIGFSMIGPYSADASLLLLGSGLGAAYVKRGLPYVYGQGLILWNGTPLSGGLGSFGGQGLAGICVPFALADGVYLGPDLSASVTYVSWDVETWDYGYYGMFYDWVTHRGSYFETQYRAGLRLLVLGRRADFDMKERMSFTVHAIWGDISCYDDYGLSSGDERTRTVYFDDEGKLGFVAAIEWTSLCMSVRCGCGYYRGFFMELLLGLGWIF